jgi:hypothetical protein
MKPGAGNVIEMHEHTGDFKSSEKVQAASPKEERGWPPFNS